MSEVSRKKQKLEGGEPKAKKPGLVKVKKCKTKVVIAPVTWHIPKKAKVGASQAPAVAEEKKRKQCSSDTDGDSDGYTDVNRDAVPEPQYGEKPGQGRSMPLL